MLNHKLPFIALGLLILLFILSKLHALGLPYFWDEAWSYAPAIAKMAEGSPCMHPGCIDPELYRGHPMFFYFLAATWMKWVSGTLFSMHAFALLLSILCLVSLYSLARKFLNASWAIFTVTLLLLQQVFYVQSSFVLPEVLLALLTLESIRSYFNKQRVYLLLCLAALGLSKETGIIILIGIALFHLFRKDERKMDSIWIYGAFLPAILFYVWQKIALGWFFYPFHQNLLDASPGALKSKAGIVIQFILEDQGRHIFLALLGAILGIAVFKSNIRLKNILSGAILLVIILSFMYPSNFALTGLIGMTIYAAGKMYDYTIEEKKFLKLATLIVMLIFAFSILNFLMLRYLIVLFPIFILMLGIVMQKIIQAQYRLAYSCFMVLTGSIFLHSFIYTYRQREWLDDVSMNYLNMVHVHKEVARYAVQTFQVTENILTHFLMYYNLSDETMGYVPAKHEFSKAHIIMLGKENPDVVILSGVEYNEGLHNQFRTDPQYILSRRFEKNKAWSEVFIKKDRLPE